MAAIDDLQAAYSSMAANLAAVLAAGPQAGVDYSIDGESYSWADYAAMLTTQLRALKIQIQLEGGPFTVRSRASV